MGLAEDFAVEGAAVVFEAGAGVVEQAAEGAREVFIDEFDGDFGDAEPLGHGLDPELHGELVADLGEGEALQGRGWLYCRVVSWRRRREAMASWVRML